MSVVEKTIRKIQEQRAAAEAASAAAAAGEAPPPTGPIVSDLAPVVFDREALRSAGLLPPVTDEQRLSSEYRRIKRPLLANAFGPEGARVRKGYLIMLASALPGEGKSFTAINLALSLSLERDIEVLLIDADVVKPQLTRVVGLEGEPGLLDVLRDPRLSVESMIRPTTVRGVSFLPSGTSSPEATELLASKRMEQVAAALEQRDSQRIALFDSPPLMQTTESAALAQVAGQIVLVVLAESTPQPVVLDALDLLQGHPSVSLVLNESGQSTTSAYYYYGYSDARSERSDGA
ncbi:MAG: P-loop NTPase [Steroidobacteraceae bacterium]